MWSNLDAMVILEPAYHFPDHNYAQTQFSE